VSLPYGTEAASKVFPPETTPNYLSLPVPPFFRNAPNPSVCLLAYTRVQQRAAVHNFPVEN
jgi:hypothetical protein